MTAKPIKIHPFDLYILIRDGSHVKECGTVPITRLNVPEPYTVNEQLYEVDGSMYCETTTVPPITKEFE